MYNMNKLEERIKELKGQILQRLKGAEESIESRDKEKALELINVAQDLYENYYKNAEENGFNIQNRINEVISKYIKACSNKI